MQALLPDTRCVIVAECPCVNCVLDYSVKRGIYVRTNIKNEKTYIFTSAENAADISAYLSGRGISSYRKRRHIYNYRKRCGVLVGGVLFVCLIAFLSSILWSVDVTGNSRLTEHDVKALLRECGVCEGVRLKDIDNDLVRIKMMSLSKDIAWVSVNVKGIRAEVVLAEAERPPRKNEEALYSNIVASYDGLITGMVIERGQQMVKVGETVKKGDLLVSGIIEERDGDISLVNASARVYALTERTVTVEQPYQTENITQIDGKMQRISLECFGKSIKFSLKYGLSGEECDIISKRGSIYIFGRFRLPFTYTAEYETLRLVDTVSLTREEAIVRAESEAYKLLFSQADAELVSRRFTYGFAEDRLTASLYAVCEENIAKSLPFTAEP